MQTGEKGVSGAVMTELGRIQEGRSVVKFNRRSTRIGQNTPYASEFPLPLISPTNRAISNSGITLTPLYPFPVPRLNIPSSLLPEGLISLVKTAAAHDPSSIPARSQPEPSCWTVAFVLFLFVLNWGKN